MTELLRPELRLYEFGQSLWSAEIKSGFTRIASTESCLSRRLIAYLRMLRADDQQSFARALTRRWNKGALQLLGEAMIPQDDQWVAAFMALVRGEPAGKVSNEEFNERAFESAGSLPSSEKGKIVSTALAQFQSLIGEPPETLRGGTLLWRVSMPAFGVTVSVDFPPRRPSMGVSYKIKTASGEAVRNQFSFYSALGLLSETNWILRSAPIAQTAVHTAGEITGELLRALSKSN
jgi:hypothetical protein